MKERDLKHDVDGRLFQASMWRRYAQEGGIYGHTREDCLRRSRLNVRLARRLNRRAANAIR